VCVTLYEELNDDDDDDDNFSTNNNNIVPLLIKSGTVSRCETWDERTGAVLT